MPCVITSVRVTIVLNLNLVLFFSILNLVDLQLILDLLSRQNRVPSALTKAGGAIGHMYDRAVIHMTDRDVRA